MSHESRASSTWDTGYECVLNVALIGVVLGVVVCLFLRETAPVKVSVPRAEMSG